MARSSNELNASADTIIRIMREAAFHEEKMVRIENEELREVPKIEFIEKNSP